MPAFSRRREPVDVPRLEADPPEPGEDVHGAATKIAPLPTTLIAEIMTGEPAPSPRRPDERATSRPPQSGIRERFLPNLSFDEEEENGASDSFSPTTLSEVPDPQEGVPTLALPPKLVSDVIRKVDLRAPPTSRPVSTAAPPPLPAIVPPSPYAAAVPIAWADSVDAPASPIAPAGASSRLTDRELAIAIGVGLVAFVVLVAATLVVLFS